MAHFRQGEGCDLLADKTYGVIQDDTLAGIFAMAQQASWKVSCKATFRLALYVDPISIVNIVTSALQ